MFVDTNLPEASKSKDGALWLSHKLSSQQQPFV